MKRRVRFLIVAASLAVLGAGGTASRAGGVADRPWPESQSGLGLDADGFDSWAARHAALPPHVVVVPPPARASKTIKEYSGVWSGWMCKGRSTDLKVAFTQVGPKAATATVAWAETDSVRGSAKLSLSRAGDEFRTQGGDVLYKFQLRTFDDVRAGLPVMDVMRIKGDGSWCSGILRRDSSS